MEVTKGFLEGVLVKAEDLDRYKKWITDLQSGMYVNCVYCGHRYGPDNETPVAMADVLKAHIAECPEHPLSQLRRAVVDAIDLIQNDLIDEGVTLLEQAVAVEDQPRKEERCLHRWHENPALINPCPEWIEHFREIKAKHGKVNAVWVDEEDDDGNLTGLARAVKTARGCGVPRIVHFQEGMRIRNWLRRQPETATWTDHDYDDRWASLTEEAIK